LINGGFTLDGISAKELNIIMGHDSERPIAPPTVDRFLSIPGVNGILDFGSDVGARQLNLNCHVISKDYRTLQQASERIASVLLDGYGKPKQLKLVFDVNPDRYFLVRYSGSLSINRLFGYGRFTLPLIVVGNPFGHSIDSSDSITWGSSVTWGSSIRWGDAWSYRVTGAGSVEINNWGTMIVKPIIELSGSLTNIAIACNGKTFGYNAPLASETLTINNNRMTVTKGSQNVLKHMTGDFIELKAGINELSIMGTNLNLDVSFKFDTLYF